jgi:hypothetical protein
MRLLVALTPAQAEFMERARICGGHRSIGALVLEMLHGVTVRDKASGYEPVEFPKGDP